MCVWGGDSHPISVIGEALKFPDIIYAWISIKEILVVIRLGI